MEPVEGDFCSARVCFRRCLRCFFLSIGKRERPRLMPCDLQMNLGGAKDRPDLNQVWENVQAKLAGKSVVHNKYAKTSFTGMVWGKVFG